MTTPKSSMASEAPAGAVAAQTQRYVVCGVDELKPGGMLPFSIRTRRLVVLRTEEGNYTALSDLCPHEGASLATGALERKWSAKDLVSGYEQDRSHAVVICPWHNFEFDISTGRSICEPNRMRLPIYEVAVEQDQVVVYA